MRSLKKSKGGFEREYIFFGNSAWRSGAPQKSVIFQRSESFSAVEKNILSSEKPPFSEISLNSLDSLWDAEIRCYIEGGEFPDKVVLRRSINLNFLARENQSPRTF
jgi:hypothetical protein